MFVIGCDIAVYLNGDILTVFLPGINAGHAAGIGAVRIGARPQRTGADIAAHLYIRGSGAVFRVIPGHQRIAHANG